MSGNPNMQKIGKRRSLTTRQEPAWLFPSNENTVNDRKDGNKDKKLSKDSLSRPDSVESRKAAPPAQLLELIKGFLSEHGFTSATQAFNNERTSQSEKKEPIATDASLLTIYSHWCNTAGNKNGDSSLAKKKLDKAATKPAKMQASRIKDGDVEMLDAPQAKKVPKKSVSSSPSISSDSDADDEDEVTVTKVISPKTKSKGLKRKAASSSSSSSSTSDSSSASSSEDYDHKAKKAKIAAESSTSSSAGSTSSSGSDSSSEDESSRAKGKAIKSSSESGSSDSSSSSSSESESDSDSSTQSIAKKTPLPDSDSDSSSSSSDSDSDSDSDSKPAKQKSVVSSDTSATLSDNPKKMTPSSSDSSSDSSSSSESESEPKTVKVIKTVTATVTRTIDPPLPPDPVLKPKKLVNVPFSRIPKDTLVDSRLSSNAYVPYDYAQKAHQDLIVTKGKGFTKEKNKKKRGSYRGGYIDVEGKKGIKFDD